MKTKKITKKEQEKLEVKNKLSDLLSQAIDSFHVARPDRIGYPMPIYCKLNHVSKSGMSRSISLHVVIEGELNKIDYFVSQLIDYKIDQKNGGIKISGCGMDMGFALVDQLMYSMGLGNDWQKHYRAEWL